MFHYAAAILHVAALSPRVSRTRQGLGASPGGGEVITDRERAMTQRGDRGVEVEHMPANARGVVGALA